MSFGHWVSRHPAILTHAKALRHVCTYEANEPACHAQELDDGINYVWPLDGWSTDSGMLAVRIALFMGFAPVHVCGIPLDTSGHFYDPPGVGHSYAFEPERWEPFLDRLRFIKSA